MKRILPFFALIVGSLLIIKGLLPHRYKSPFSVAEFATLPALKGGRLKPMDSIARNSLVLLRGRQSFRTASGEKKSAIEWLMDVTMKPETADTYPVFRITNPELLSSFGLPQKDEFYYAFSELSPHLEEIDEHSRHVNPEAPLRTPYERSLIKLRSSLIEYHQLIHSLFPPDTAHRVEEEYNLYQSIISQSIEAFNKQQAGEEFDEETFNRFMAFAQRYQRLSQNAAMRVVPPTNPFAPPEDWKDIGTSIVSTTFTNHSIDQIVFGYARLVDAYRHDEYVRFNEILGELKEMIGERYPGGRNRIRFERFFNAFQPFLLSSELYLLLFLLACASWLLSPQSFGRSAFWLLLLTLAIHSFGLIARMYIQGRPPVTNLYSSAVFVGWGAVILSAIVERLYRNGIGCAVAGMIGFCTLIIAHNLSATGDTLEMMRAVLDDNFWLATHVVIINLGYAGTFLAGFMALIFLFRGLLTRGLDDQTAIALVRMTYGTVCFALLFSFVGTILGGIWADQSWGRFWGWDPKENGALMIVIWNALILHARWGRLVQRQGFMVLAIGGNIITSWSWFGTNMLGIGLHSYGFMDSAFFWLMSFVGSQILLILLGSLPRQYWRSPQALGRI